MTTVRYISWRKSLVPLLIGLFVGCLVTAVLMSADSKSNADFPRYMSYNYTGDLSSIKEEPQNATTPTNMHLEVAHANENQSISQKLYKEVRVLCWVMTQPENHKERAIHIKRTWGSRCNRLLFMSSKEDPEIGSIALPVGEGRDNLWAKTKAAFKYVYENHLDEADWFMKADDDTYVIAENLRYMLYPHSPSTPIYFGCRFKAIVKQGYMSGGAGYVLSKEALRRFVEEALPNPDKCSKTDDGAEDLEMGKCMENVNVTAGDSRDNLGRGRFFPFLPETHLVPGEIDRNEWYWDYIYYKPEQGMDCCSDNAVSFHYVPPNMMYVMDYMIYHLRPFGIANNSLDLPKIPTPSPTNDTTTIPNEISSTSESDSYNKIQ